MVYNEGLAVGLGIGITVAVVFAISFLIWIRNQRQQKREDNLEDAIDIDLRDNHSFSKFQEELHKPYSDPNKSSTTQSAETNDDSVDKEKLNHDTHAYISSNNSSSATDITNPPPSHTRQGSFPISTTQPPAPPHLNSHTKSGSSYDFYETFIPILPSEHSVNNPNDISALTQPPAISGVSHSNNNDPNTTQDSGVSSVPTSSNSSNTSIIGNFNNNQNTNNTTGATNNQQYNKSLDNLAKQLASPAFFEKLPSRAATVSLKHRPPHPIASSSLPNNSSGDLLKNNLAQDDAINDNYVYEAAQINTTSSPTKSNRMPSVSSASTSNYNNKRHTKISVLSGFENVEDEAEDEDDKNTTTITNASSQHPYRNLKSGGGANKIEGASDHDQSLNHILGNNFDHSFDHEGRIATNGSPFEDAAEDPVVVFK